MRPPLSLLAALALAAAPSAQTPIGWADDASELRGRSGTVSVVCPAAGAGDRSRSVWGANPYTDDSSVCKAAVHAGAIGWGGGTVVIEPQPGRDSYPTSTQNGVTTSSYGAWGGSFAVVSGPIPRGRTITWADTAGDLRGTTGRVTVVCPAARGADDRRRAVWGTDTYTDDSSVCRAAVHAGVIGWGGGAVTVEPRPGQPSYRASTRNGVTTSSYGAWGGSFVFVR